MRAGRASTTALGVARWLALRAGDRSVGERLPPGWYEDTVRLLLVVSRRSRWELPLSRRAAFVRWLRFYERLTVPAIARHLATRKAFVDAEVRAALAGGARQLVVVGAGFDTLAGRVGRERSDVLCVEVDHPATQELKQTALAGAGLDEGVVLAPGDLSVVELSAVLEDLGRWDPGLPSVLVAEGLLMYLSAEEVERLLRSFAGVCASGSRAILTYAEPGVGRHGSFHRSATIERLLLRLAREPLRWLPAAAEFEGLVEGAGWSLVEPRASAFVVAHPAAPRVRTSGTGLKEFFAVAGR